MQTTKRDNYITWDEYFMGVALLSAKRSKDPSTQVGACIVNAKNKIVGRDDQFSPYRIGLTGAFSTVMKNGMWLLGIRTLEKM